MTAATASAASPGASRAALPRYAHRRGTRGFAAFAIGLAGFRVARRRCRRAAQHGLRCLATSWLIPLTAAFGIAHFVAAYGLIRRRSWSPNLTGYLAAMGIDIATYGLLVTLTGLDPFGAASSLPSDRAWADGVGLLVWMIGLWVIAVRYAARAVRPR